MNGFKNEGSAAILKEIAVVIVQNKAYLSEIDGKIGDGDHGVNMAKGFARAAERVKNDESLQTAFDVLSNVLMTEIGGSMGPLYGMMFSAMAESLLGVETVDAQCFSSMLEAGLGEVQEIGSAKVGDKTLVDTLVPAVEEFRASIESGDSYKDALVKMKSAAEKGRDSTIDLVAKIGRSSRLGERSRGALDAGATSCCLILSTLADSVSARMVSA